MSPRDEKKRSGRDRAAKSEKKKSEKKKGTPVALGAHGHELIEDGRELHSPWLPLIWMLIPLIACVVYGLATR